MTRRTANYFERNHHVDIHIGNRLHLLRTGSEIQQKALAGRLGVSRQQIRKYESAENRLSVSMLYEIADIFDVPMSYFFDGLSEANALQGGANEQGLSA